MTTSSLSKSLIDNIHWLLIILSVLCNAFLAAVLFYFVFLSPDVGAQPNTINADTWSTNGTVYDIDISSDGTVYLGGSFSYVGPNTGHAVLANASSGEFSAYPAVRSTGSSNFFREIISDGSGGWYIAGGFRSVNGVARTGLARITSSGTLDPVFNPDFGSNATIYSLLLQGETLYVGGIFSSVNGASQNGIAALSATTGATDPDFTVSMTQSWDTVHTMVIENGILYLGGNFSGVGSNSRNSLAAVNLSDSSVTSWDPNAGSFSTVYDMALTSSALYVGGGFTTIGSDSRNYLASVSTSTGAATSWNLDPSGYVYDLELDGANLYVAGDFSTIGGEARTRLAAVDTASGSVTTWAPSVDNTIYDIDINGDTVYLAGSFLTVGGSSRARVASLSKTTGEVGALVLQAGASAYAIKSDGTNVYVGGDFTSIGGVLRKNLAAISSATGQATSWNPPDINNTVKTVEVDSSVVYFGGTFTEVNSTSRNRLASVNRSDASLTSWDPSLGGFGGVNDAQLDGSVLYVGGSFTTVGGDERTNLAAIDKTTGSSTSWWPNVTGGWSGIKALAVSSTVVYIGGDFTAVGGDERNYLAAVDKTTGSSTSWNPNPAKDFSTPVVDALAVDGSIVYVGGNFATIGGASRNYLAAFNGETVSDWNPNPTIVCGFCERITKIFPTSSLVYVAGSFTDIGGASNDYLAAINKTTGLATDWAPRIPSGSEAVRSMDIYNSVLYIGGSLTAVNSDFVTGFAQFSPISLGFSSTTVSGMESVTSTNFTVGITNGVTSTQSITIDYSATGGTATGSGGDYTLTSGTATILAGQTSTTIPLSVVADTSIEADETVVVTLANPTNAQLGVNATLTYTILNDDTVSAGVTVSESASSTVLSESGTTDTYTVVLNSEPSDDVVITLTTSTQLLASPATITFTDVNWETPQTVTVTAVNDRIAEGAHTGTVTHTATSLDDDYDGIVVSSVVATITDNDTAGITVAESSDTTEVSEDGLSDTFSLVLTSQPTSTVAITLPVLNDVSFSTSSIIFSSANWNSVQTVTVSAINDTAVESIETATVTFTVSSTDSNYNNFSISSFLVSIVDNDTTGALTGPIGAVVAVPPVLPVVTIQPTPQVVETRTITESSPATVFVGGASHSISLISHSSQSATIVIRSEPIVLTVTNGVPSEVDVDKDGNNDLRVVYLGEIAGLPEFEFISLSDSTEKDKPISINQGDYSTKNREVLVQFNNVKGVVSIALSHTPSFVGSDFQPYQSAMSWVLPDGAGEKRVYARLRSGSGGYVDVSDSIIYDPSSVLAGSCPVETERPYQEYGKKEVYLVLDKNSLDSQESLFSCTKRVFVSSDVYFSYFDSWEEIQLVDSVVMNAIPNDRVNLIPWGPKRRVKDGELLKTITDPKVYFILGPSRHWIASSDVFDSLNFVWGSVQDSAGSLVERFKVGKDIVTPTDLPPGTFIRYASSTNNIYFLQQDPENPTSTWKRAVQKTSLIRRVLKTGSVITLPSEVVFPDGPALK